MLVYLMREETSVADIAFDAAAVKGIDQEAVFYEKAIYYKW
jgi:hypothetical protein